MKTTIALVVIMVFAVGPLYGEDRRQPPPTPSEEQPEVLTRGPVHEAFAEPVDLNTQPSLVAPTQPPANITENPPAERPTGQQFVWVPGYWAWDSEQKRLYLGQRLLASRPAKQILGAGILVQNRPGLGVGSRFLGAG